jgi:DNA-directed RNA polymerase subunit RPC12/RpoP
MPSWFSKILSHREIASHRKDNTVCDQCGQKFEKYDELIAHARHVHHHPIVKCHDCGKEFIHEKDRLHHVKEEHEKKVDRRTHKWEHAHDKKINPQEQVDEQKKNFGDNF